MNLLTEGIEKGYVIPTELTRKTTIDGITEVYPVYKVKLECLYFNDRNDRIATWISKYKEENHVDDFEGMSREEYNSIIHEFIRQSNPEALKKTKNNINLMEQRVPGVILNDGRIIDGNRRFTCLRELVRENLVFGHFETIILDQDIDNSEKQIKMLELMIQRGEETKVDYNPIDRLVGIYNDIIKNKLLTIDEYRLSTNQTPKEIKEEVEVAKLLAEFLEFSNAPEKFYLGRELDLNGPLRELKAILAKIKDNSQKEQMKAVIFTNLLMQPTGDMTRYIRQVKAVTNTRYMDDFIEESLEESEEIIEALEEKEEVDSKAIAEIRTMEESSEKLKKSMEKAVTKVKVHQTKNKPADNLEKALNVLESIDTGIFVKLSPDQIDDLTGLCDKLHIKVTELKEVLNV